METMIETWVNVEDDDAIIDAIVEEEVERLDEIGTEGDGDVAIDDYAREYEEDPASYEGRKHSHSEGMEYPDSVTPYLESNDFSTECKMASNRLKFSIQKEKMNSNKKEPPILSVLALRGN